MARITAVSALAPVFAVTLGCAAARHPVAQPLPPQSTEVQNTLVRIRELGGAKIAPASLERAEALLAEFESLHAQGDRPEAQRWIIRLALSEARHALMTTELKLAVERRNVVLNADRQALQARLHKTQQENRRLEDRIDVLLRDLDLTETEIIRTKARLKNLETHAEASSTIAEAQILLSRANRATHSTSTISRCQELIERAKEQVRAANYSAAAFFALKAQDLLRRSRRTLP